MTGSLVQESGAGFFTCGACSGSKYLEGRAFDPQPVDEECATFATGVVPLQFKVERGGLWTTRYTVGGAEVPCRRQWAC